MSLGTITIPGGADAQGPIFHDRISFVGDDAYPTGGTVGFNALLQAVTKDQREVLAVIGNDGTNAYEYDFANDTLIARVMATGAEVADTTDLSGATANLLVISK